MDKQKQSQEIIPQCGNEALEQIIRHPKNNIIKRAAQKELDRRHQLGISRPLTIEDYL